MPSVSRRQARLMAAVAHGWKPPVSSGIRLSREVAEEFNREDVRRGVLSGVKKKKK